MHQIHFLIPRKPTANQIYPLHQGLILNITSILDPKKDNCQSQLYYQDNTCM